MEQGHNGQATKPDSSKDVQAEGTTSDLSKKVHELSDKRAGDGVTPEPVSYVVDVATTETKDTSLEHSRSLDTSEATASTSHESEAQESETSASKTQEAKSQEEKIQGADTPVSKKPEAKTPNSGAEASGGQKKDLSLSSFVLHVGFDPNQYPDFLDLELEAALRQMPGYKSSIDQCAPYVFLGKKDELLGDENFVNYDDYEDVDDDDDEEETPAYHGEYNQAYLAQYDRQQMVPWVYPGAKWAAGQNDKKRLSIREKSYQGYNSKTHTIKKMDTLLERYYSEIREGGRLKVDEKRAMLALLQERNRLFMPSGTRSSTSKLNIKKLSQKEQEALKVIKSRLRSLTYYAQERDLYYTSEVAEEALLWFQLKDANMLNQLRSLNGSGLLFAQAEKHPFKDSKGYTWYVNVRPKSFVELVANLKQFMGLRIG